MSYDYVDLLIEAKESKEGSVMELTKESQINRCIYIIVPITDETLKSTLCCESLITVVASRILKWRT
jgi:hypothetical protein